MRNLILGACCAALLSSAAYADSGSTRKTSPRSSKVVKVVKVEKVENHAPDMAAVMAMFDKLFPPQPDPDPARLALARTTAAAIWPNGAYANMMVGVMSHAYDGAMQMKASDLPGMAGKGAEANLSLHDMAVSKDPYFDQRATAIRAAINDGATQVSAILDPRAREGLARSMARRFDGQQLADINAFLATPSGRAFAGQYMQMWVDPEMMRAIVATMPDMMKLMPAMMDKVKVAAAQYPEPGKDKPAAAKDKPAGSKS